MPSRFFTVAASRRKVDCSCLRTCSTFHRYPIFELLEALERALGGIEIRESATEPALGYVQLRACPGRFLDRCLRLFLGADEKDFASFGHRLGEKIAGRFELSERLAEIDNVNAVARIKNEFLHFWVPTFGLVSEMNTCVQQFFNANT